MSTTVFKLKKSSVAGRVPTASDLAYGELALNYTDGLIYFKNSSNQIKNIADSSHTALQIKDSVTSSVIKGFNYLQAPHGSTVTFTVTVASKDATHRYNGQGSGNGYKIDGVFAPFLTLTPGRTYRFDQADSSNSGHPLRFYYDAAKTVAFTTNVTTNGTAGSGGAYTEITITDATPTVLHYQCSAHGYMGNSVQTNARNLTGFTTDNLSEGSSNLYYTQARFNTAFAAKSTSDLSEGTNLYYTTARSDSDAGALVDSSYVRARQIQYSTNDFTDSAFVTAQINAVIDAAPGALNTLNELAAAIGDDANFSTTITNSIATKMPLAGGTFTGDVTFDSAGGIVFDKSDQALEFGDNYKAVFGTGSDLQIYHDGSNSRIVENGTGNLRISSDFIAITNAADNKTMASFAPIGAVSLRHNNSVKFVTTSSGIQTTGTVDINGAYSFPTSIGSAGQVLKVPSSGTVLEFANDSGGGGGSGEANQNAFSTIAVAGQSNVVADTATDTLTFVAGTGMTITTSAGNDQVTFTSSAAGIDSAAVLALIDSDYVGARSVDSSEVTNLIDSSYVSARSSGGNAFGTIAVSGQSNVVADQANDTLTLAAGSGITLATTAGTDTVTITSTASGGSLVTGNTQSTTANLFTGNNSTTAFTLSSAPGHENNVTVTINGVSQHTDTFSISGTTLTLDSAPATGDTIEARVFNQFSSNVALRDYQSYVYQPSSSTTTFSGSDLNSNTLAYDVGKLDVYVNGARLVNGLDYTANTGTSVVLQDAIDSGDTIEIGSFSASTLVNPGIAATDSDLTTTTANQIVDTFSKTQFRTVKYIAQIEHDSSEAYHAEEILLTHDGTNVGMTTYAQVLMDSNLGTFDADIAGDTVRLKFTPTKTNTSTKLRKIQVVK